MQVFASEEARQSPLVTPAEATAPQLQLHELIQVEVGLAQGQLQAQAPV